MKVDCIKIHTHTQIINPNAPHSPDQGGVIALDEQETER